MKLHHSVNFGPANQQIIFGRAVLGCELCQGHLVAELFHRQGTVSVNQVHAQPALLLLRTPNLSLVSCMAKNEEVFASSMTVMCDVVIQSSWYKVY